MGNLIIKNGTIINEGREIQGDILIQNGRISKVGGIVDIPGLAQEILAEGMIVIPGIIDDQVHFREPGLTYKADIASESRAALAGGVTSFMEMPNTKPAALTQALLEEKYVRARQTSLTNYSFFMGASNENLEEVLRTDAKRICGIKIFMGSSTGNMLVDEPRVLENLFSQIPILIATHCEDEATIKNNFAIYNKTFGETLTAQHHPRIRSAEGCLKSSSFAVDLAKKHNTRLHILHISTLDEINLFSNELALENKRITAEVCVHHLYFDAGDYEYLGNKIKCNPAIKDPAHKEALFAAMLQDKLDIIATDHAPHLLEEKNQPYREAPSGLPLVQHSLPIMLDFYHQGKIDLTRIVEKMCHAPAICFQIKERGFIREGYHADIVIVDPEKNWTVSTENIEYKCGWSPLEGKQFKGAIIDVILNGRHVLRNGEISDLLVGERLQFSR